MTSRTAPLTLLAVLVASLAGCAPAPVPSAEPSPAFANEAEAFAAAEETYRAYVDALNQVDLSDPETFEEVYAWTTGEANAGARETFSEMHADELVVDGTTELTGMSPRNRQGGSPTDVSLDVCLDVSEVTLVDETGESVVAPDRQDIQSMLVTMTITSSSTTGMLISEITGRDGGLQCDA